jgi:hypothetical protein
MGSSTIGNSEFKPTGTADVFEIVAYGGTATFRRKEAKVTGMLVQVNDINMEGTKEEGSLAITGTGSPAIFQVQLFPVYRFPGF